MTAALTGAAPELAATALRTVQEEFPNGLYVHYTQPGDAPARPRDRHPAFYGSYDWHSSVEMHWVLLRLLRVAGAAVPAAEITAVFDEHGPRRPSPRRSRSSPRRPGRSGRTAGRGH